MSAAKHTPGLLVRDTSGAPKPDVRAESGRAVAVTWMVCPSTPKTAAGYQSRQDEDRANADRIVAAWNACDGISTEALDGGVVRELLDALQELVQIVPVLRPTCSGDERAVERRLERATAAITKATKATGSANHG